MVVSTTSIVVAKKQRLVPKPICIRIATKIDKIVIAIGIESLSGRDIVRGEKRSAFPKSDILCSIIHRDFLSCRRADFDPLSSYRASIFNSISEVVRFLPIANSAMNAAMIVFDRKFVRIISSSLHIE